MIYNIYVLYKTLGRFKGQNYTTLFIFFILKLSKIKDHTQIQAAYFYAQIIHIKTLF